MFAVVAPHTPTAKAETNHYFVVLDGTWLATDFVWSEIETVWLVAATIKIAKAPPQKLTGPEMFAAFCAEILRARPGAPASPNKDNEIFRVDININDANGRPITKVPAPISVKQGKCQITDGNDRLLPTYPGKLQGWQLANGNVRRNGESHRRTILFVPSRESNVKVADFDMALACNATLKDPTVQTLQSNFEQRLRNVTVEPNIVTIYAKERATKGVYAQMTFDTSDGTCVELK